MCIGQDKLRLGSGAAGNILRQLCNSNLCPDRHGEAVFTCLSSIQVCLTTHCQDLSVPLLHFWSRPAEGAGSDPCVFCVSLHHQPACRGNRIGEGRKKRAWGRFQSSPEALPSGFQTTSSQDEWLPFTRPAYAAVGRSAEGQGQKRLYLSPQQELPRFCSYF